MEGSLRRKRQLVRPHLIGQELSIGGRLPTQKLPGEGVRLVVVRADRKLILLPLLQDFTKVIWRLPFLLQLHTLPGPCSPSQWLTPVTLATQEAEIRRIAF
jgi:hypothetical protein